MEVIKRWIICVCVSSVISGIIYLLCSDFSAKKAVKSVVSVFMICAFLYPFIDGKSIEFDFPEIEISSSSEELKNSITEEMKSTVSFEAENKVREVLKSIDITEITDVKCETDLNENNEIFVRKITLNLDEKFSSKKKQIEANLKELFTAEVEFFWN